MNVFYNDDKRITGFSKADGKGSGYFIHCPASLRTITVKQTEYQQKKDALGRLLYLTDAGDETFEAVTNYRDNVPAMEPVVKTQVADLINDPSAISLDDLIAAKYDTLAQSKKYWFDEFLTNASIVACTAAFNVRCVMLAPGAYLQFVPLFTGDVTELVAQIEAGDKYDKAGLTLEYSFDGGDSFQEAQDLITLEQPYNRFIFRITNNTEAMIPVYSFAVFF